MTVNGPIFMKLTFRQYRVVQDSYMEFHWNPINTSDTLGQRQTERHGLHISAFLREKMPDIMLAHLAVQQ